MSIRSSEEVFDVFIETRVHCWSSSMHRIRYCALSNCFFEHVHGINSPLRRLSSYYPRASQKLFEFIPNEYVMACLRRTDEPTPTERRAAMIADQVRGGLRAQRRNPVFNIDIETCSVCGGAVRIIACIENLIVIEKFPPLGPNGVSLHHSSHPY